MRCRARSTRADATALARLFHRAWGASILAQLLSGRGAKLVTLTSRLGAPRDSVRRTLDALADQGLVARNPGYGHPMRPEWILTKRGERVARACGTFLEIERRACAARVSRRKWAVPVLYGLFAGADRFSELGAALPSVTARALASTLRTMESVGVVKRRVLDSRPPRVVYGVATGARRLERAVLELAEAAGAGTHGGLA